MNTRMTESLEKKPVLLGLTLEELKEIAIDLGLPTFVGKQLAGWIYGHKVNGFEQMTNLSKIARERLAANYEIGSRAPVDAQYSKDGTIKYLYQTAKGDYIETVYIPTPDRATLCVSCQVGCKMHCVFCMTGRQGWTASLSAADILNQIYSLPEREKLTNIVFMGQGEPFDNLDNVLRATTALTAEWGYAWSPKRITVSSVGLAKGLVRFLDESQCNLAISLHHPIPSERLKLMPAEQAFGITDVVNVLRQYDFCRKDPVRRDTPKQRRLSFEYIVFDGVNDSKEHAQAIVELLRGLDCRMNLIRFHDISETPLRGVNDERMIEFRDYLTNHGVFATIRSSRGQDIFAACGLLTTKKLEEEKNQK